MTLAFVGLTLLALALIVVPRVQRARRPRVAPRRRPAVAMAGAGVAPVTARWSRAAGPAPAAPLGDLDDEWDDDLGWVEPEPRGRVADAPAGHQEGDAPPADSDFAARLRRDDPPADDVDARLPAERGEPHDAGEIAARRQDGLGDAPGEIAARDDSVGDGSGEIARREDGLDDAGEIVARRQDDAPDPHAPLELEDDDWRFDPPPVRATAAGPAPAYSTRPVKRRRGPLGSPVFLLALYSCAGIALIVLAVNLLSGSLGGTDRETAPPAPEPVATVQAAAPVPEPEPTVSAAELDRRRDAAAAAITAARAAAERAERRAVAAEKRRIARERRARAAARRRAAQRRREAAAATPPASTAPAAPAPPAPPSYVPPTSSGGSSGGGGGGRSCEFCIG